MLDEKSEQMVFLMSLRKSPAWRECQDASCRWTHAKVIDRETGEILEERFCCGVRLTFDPSGPHWQLAFGKKKGQ